MAEHGGDNLAEAVKRAKELAAKMIPAAGIEDSNSRKRPLDESDEGPQVKKPSIDVPLLQQPIVSTPSNPQAIAQAAIAKVGAQLGLTQMITIEIKIPNRLVGLVIGRQGEMINRLQSDSQARIQVAPDGSEIAGERKVTICGTPETVERAKMMVSKIVEDAGGATTMPVSIVNLDPGQEIVELSIPANKVGLIIGKGGEMIKALQEQAGCKMQMIQDGMYATTPEKPLRMTGLPEQCRKGRELVLRLIEQKELEARGLVGDFGKAPGMPGMPGMPGISGIPQTMEVRNVEVQVPKSLVGFVIGRQGEHINNIQNTCGVRLQFQNDIPGVEYRIATISGPPDACQRAKTMVGDIVAERQTSGGGGFKPRLELPNPTGPGVATVQYPVPAQKCGLIIGKGGDTIRQIQVQSGAHIELHRGEHPNPHEKLFNIRGSPQNIEHAQSIIRQKLEMQPSGPGGQYPSQGAVAGLPYQGGGHMYGGPQQAAYAGAQGGATQWAQYPYQQAYGATQAQQEAQTDPSHQAAWAAYYQQLYAAQAQAAQQQGAQVNPQQQQHPQQQPGAAQAANVQAHWAEYYRSLNMSYYNQQGGQQQNPTGGETGAPGGGGEPGK